MVAILTFSIVRIANDEKRVVLMSNEQIYFEKVSNKHQDIIFSWLAEPHMQEFWDNSQEHKDDIVNFIQGRKTPSNYFNGIFTYWVGLIHDEPYCFLLTAEVIDDSDCLAIWRTHLSSTGKTYSLDFGIGNPAFLGKGLAAPTLEAFTSFFSKNIDPLADTFFIDPDENNPRAIHVYEKAGFKMVGDYIAAQGAFKGQTSHLMVKQIKEK